MFGKAHVSAAKGEADVIALAMAIDTFLFNRWEVQWAVLHQHTQLIWTHHHASPLPVLD